MDIGNRLKELRVLKGLTQEELADRSELSKGCNTVPVYPSRCGNHADRYPLSKTACADY